VSFTWEPFGPTRRMTEPADQPAAEAPAAAPARVSIPSRKEPRRRLVVITCMDARIDPLAVLGLRLGDANVIRNAGATVSDDVLRSLGAAVSKLGVVRAVVMGHTDCAGHVSDQAASASVADGARRVRGAMPDGFSVDALMYDVRTGAVNPL
jgi:carbonic anhydrase